MTSQTVQVEAEVVSVRPRNKYERYNPGTNFRILTCKSRKYYDCFASFDLPLREGDKISGRGVLERNEYGREVVRITAPPIVAPDESRQGFIRLVLMKLRGVSVSKATAIYDWIEQQLKTSDSSTVVGWLNAMADKVVREKIATAADEFRQAFPDVKVDHLLNWWSFECGVRRLYLLGLTRKEVGGCHMAYDKAYELLLANPYLLINLSLERADAVLRITRKVLPASARRCGEIARILLNHVNERQWTCTPLRVLQNEASDSRDHLAELTRPLFNTAERGYGCVIEYDAIYLAHQHHVESEFAALIKQRIGQPEQHREPYFPADGVQPSASQREAVEKALNNYVTLTYGEAGTGKTTCFKFIIDNLELYKVEYVIVSFTGKAVSRAKAVTKRASCYTIHRTLGMDLGATDTTLPDESSMIETPLMYQYLRSHPEITHIIFTGDPKQLLPLGWGAMFTQLLKAGTIPTTRLLEQHRQLSAASEAEQVTIYSNLQRILNGQRVLPGDKFHLLEGGFGELIRVVNELNDYGKQFVIVTPINRVVTDVNEKVREIVNPYGLKVVEPNKREWRVGDRVICTENCYSIGVYNGDEGVITDVFNDAVQVSFTEGSYKFPFAAVKEDNGDDFEEREEPISTKLLALAWCITVHKSQGSEAPVVIFYVPDGLNASAFFCVNLVYTGTSRAKEEVYIVGRVDKYQEAISKEPAVRHEYLYRRLQA